MPLPCKTLGARAGSLNRNLVAHARDLGAPGDRAPIRQQPCLVRKWETTRYTEIYIRSRWESSSRPPDLINGCSSD